MKRTHIWLLVIIITIGSFGLLGCKTAQPAVTVKAAEETQEQMPTAEPTPEPLFYGADVSTDGIEQMSNLMNFPSFTVDEGWIYGITYDKVGIPLFTKFRADGSEKKTLDPGAAYNVLVHDGYVYYAINRTPTSSYGIMRIRTDGSGNESILDGLGEFQIVGDKIYYADQSYQYTDEYAQSNSSEFPADKAHLVRCNLDGSDQEEIIAKPVFYFYVLGNAIIYQDDNDGSSLHVCGLDGANDRKIADGYAFCPIYDGEYIYYIKKAMLSSGSERSICRVRPDGTEEMTVADINAYGGILLNGDAIYYINADDGYRIYRVNKDGTGDTPITQQGNIVSIQFLGEGLVYTAYTSDQSAIDGNYLCALDGSNPRKLR